MDVLWRWLDRLLLHLVPRFLVSLGSCGRCVPLLPDNGAMEQAHYQQKSQDHYSQHGENKESTCLVRSA